MAVTITTVHYDDKPSLFERIRHKTNPDLMRLFFRRNLKKAVNGWDADEIFVDIDYDENFTMSESFYDTVWGGVDAQTRIEESEDIKIRVDEAELAICDIGEVINSRADDADITIGELGELVASDNITIQQIAQAVAELGEIVSTMQG